MTSSRISDVLKAVVTPKTDCDYMHYKTTDGHCHDVQTNAWKDAIKALTGKNQAMNEQRKLLEKRLSSLECEVDSHRLDVEF